MTNKFYLYARKSSETEEKQVMSIEAQLVELADYARKEGILITEKFVESKSAKQPGRLEFNRMIEKIYASKEPVGIIAWHPDRLARNSVDGGQIIYLIDQLKITALKFPTFWFEPTPQGLFMLQVAFGQSKYYSDNLAQNIKRGIRQKLRRGEYFGSAPLGYLHNAKTRNIEPDPMKGRLVKKAFSEYAKGGYSLVGIKDKMNLWGLTTRVGKPLALSTVHKIMRNPAYIGVIIRKGETYEGSFEPLIKREVWEAVQARLKENGRPRRSKHKYDFPFGGLLKCGECGGAITAQFARGNGGTYAYYRCSKKFGPCSQGYLRDDLMEEQLREYVKQIQLPEGWAEMMEAQIDLRVRDERRNREAAGREIERCLEENEQKLDKLVAGFLDGMIERSSYLRKKDQLVKTKAELIDKKSELKRGGVYWVEPLRDWLETAVCAEKLASSNDLHAVKSFLEKIGSNRLLLDKIALLDFVPPFDLITLYKQKQAAPTKKTEAANKIVAENSAGWRRWESNPRPLDCQSSALAN
jgi:site-specific DNA recombinase